MSLSEVDFIGPVQKAIWSVLSAASFTIPGPDGALIGVKCYDSPDKNTPPPYIAFGEPNYSPYRTKLRNGAKLIFPIFAVTEYKGLKLASSLIGQVLAALTKQKLDLASSGLAVITFHQLSSEAIRFDDTLVARLMRLETIVMESTAQSATPSIGG